MRKVFLVTVIMAMVVAAEHWVLARVWRGYELARRTMGIATVMGAAAVLIPSGMVETRTWMVIMGQFGVAGAVTAGLYTHEAAVEAAGRRQAMQEAMDGCSQSARAVG